MSEELRASLRIVGFETRYVPLDSSKPDLGTKPVDYVITSPRGMAKFTETPIRIIDAQRMTNGLWDIVKPHYEAWKAGQAMPETGTPLAAWNGATKQQVEVLKGHSILTVEDFAGIPDSILERLGMGMRDAREAAKRFVAASDTRQAASQIAKIEAENEALRQQMADLMALVGKDNAEEPVKRKPGRPRKEDVEEAA